MTELDPNPGKGPAAPAPPREGAPTPADDKPALFHHSLAARIRNYSDRARADGPRHITISLTGGSSSGSTTRCGRSSAAYRPKPIRRLFPGLGLIIAFVSLTLLGFLTANLVGRTLVGFGENILNRMPVVRPVYKALKQIFETLFSKSGSSFRRVALVEFPSPGMWSLVFLSQPASPDIAARLPQTEHLAAFMPCTPNPTTGFFFYVPRRDLIELDITVESAMTLLMSAGMVQPGGGGDQQKKLAALAEAARVAHAAHPSRATAPAK